MNSLGENNSLPQNIVMFGVTVGFSLPYSLTAKKHLARQTFPVASYSNSFVPRSIQAKNMTDFVPWPAAETGGPSLVLERSRRNTALTMYLLQHWLTGLKRSTDFYAQTKICFAINRNILLIIMLLSNDYAAILCQ